MTYPQPPARLKHGRPIGLDWDYVRASYAAQMDRQVAEGVDDHETQSWAAEKAGIAPPKPPTKPRRTARDAFGGFGGSSPRYDRKAIADMYVKDRMTVDDIAEKTGAHRQTVRNNLKAAGVALRDDRIGNPRGRMGRK